MELDELKTAWTSLDRRLEQQNKLALKVFTGGKLDQARSRLRPLYWGQVAQILYGIVVAVMGGFFWPEFVGVPHLLIAGLIVHLYGILAIVFGASVVWMINHIDYAAPVMVIQKQLADLQRLHIRNGLINGASWWLIWIPFLMVLLMGPSRFDLYANAPSVIYLGSAIGVAALLLTWLLYRASSTGRRPALARFMRNNMIGNSLRNAESVIAEIARFEQE